MEELQAASVHSDERELLQLLSTPHLRVVTQSLPTHAAHVPLEWGPWGALSREAEERRVLSGGVLSTRVWVVVSLACDLRPPPKSLLGQGPLIPGSSGAGPSLLLLS